MRIIVMLIIVGMENRLMGEVELDFVDFFKEWFWEIVLVVGVCGFFIFVVLNGVLGIIVNDWIKNIFVINIFYIFIVLF